MKVEELIATKDYKTEKVRIHTAKKKRKQNIKSETDPHTSNIDTNYGMTAPGMDAVIHP